MQNKSLFCHSREGGNVSRQSSVDRRGVWHTPKSPVVSILMLLTVCVGFPAFGAPQGVAAAVAPNLDAVVNDLGAAAVADYQVDGSMFQKIADMEQEKVLFQLEKERAQLDLDLDRLAAEKIKLQMELDTIAGKADEQKAQMEADRQKLEADKQRFAQQQAAASSAPAPTSRASAAPAPDAAPAKPLTDRYRLIEIVGAGGQLQATIEDLSNGQRKKVWAGKDIDGYNIKSVSLDDGIAFERDGVVEHLYLDTK